MAVISPAWPTRMGTAMPSRRASTTAWITGWSWAAATAMTPGVPPRAASMMPSMVWIILLFLLVSIHKKTVALVYHSDHIIQRCTGPVNEKTPNGSIKFHTAGTWVWPPQKKTPYPVRIGGAAAGRFSYFRLCATATATATVAPTMGLLPMPKKPIISTWAGTEEEPANCASECIRPMVSVMP